jgi:penicillin G amidase
MRGALAFGGRLVVRLFKLVVVVIILVLLALLVMGAIATQRGWPQTSGTIALKGLQRQVTVIRDYAGILQITADSPHDLFMAQGYAHAQERMWQMEISRRIGAGRLAELFGKSAVDRDRYIRTLGWRDAAQRDLNAMSPETKAVLQAYADGVNAWITEHDGRLSTPFVVAGLLSGTGGIGGYTLEPWTPLDTATWQKVQAWSLGGNVDSEIFRFLVDARLHDPARTDELFPPYSATAPVITPTGLKGSGGAGAAEAAAAGGSDVVATAAASLSVDHVTALADLGRLGSSISAFAGLDRGGGLVGDEGVGSNNWVVSGEHTRSGDPILANDPHLGFGMPSVWIINGLHCRVVSDACPWDVVGVTFPGAPAVVLGHNARIAWGATNVNPDTQDLFLITPDTADPQGHYIHDGQRLPFEIRPETIKVSGAPPVEIDVRSTVHGVVLSDVDRRLKDGPILAMRWTSTAEVDLALESFFRVDIANDFDEFRAAFDGYGSPSQNFTYADVDGHIGYVLPGLIPLRAGPDGLRVRDGGSSAEDWTGYVPREDLPWQLDPAGGQIVTANNAPVDDGYPYWLGSEWDPGFRAERVTQLLAAAGDKLTLDAMRDIQLDDYVLRSDQILPRLMATSPKPQTEDGKLLLTRLAEWDGECDVASYGCAAYMSVELAVERAIFDDELGPIARDYVGSAIAWQALSSVLGQGISPWWNNAAPGAAPTLDPAARVAEAIDATGVALRAAFGEPANWTWGNLHQVTFKESTLGSSGILPLELYFNAQPRAVAGADGTINNTYSQASRAYPDSDDPTSTGVGLDELFDVAGGPSYRLLVDMGDLNGARIVITTGQSGNAFDPHSIDLIPLWIAGDSVPLPFSKVNVDANAAQTLTLTPG